DGIAEFGDAAPVLERDIRAIAAHGDGGRSQDRDGDERPRQTLEHAVASTPAPAPHGGTAYLSGGYDLEIHREDPAGGEPPLPVREARHALPRPGRGLLRLDRARDAEEWRLAGAAAERTAVRREAAALLLADGPDLLGRRPLRVGGPSLVGARRAGHGPAHLPNRTAPLRAGR